jgi:hypothetical protein
MIKFKWLILLFLVPLTFVLLWQMYSAWVLPWHQHWGMTEEELSIPLPGDEGRAPDSIEGQHGIMINVPAQKVWPWLVQVGANRGGWYSYHWLENLFFCGIHNAYKTHPELQNLNKGDVIKICVYGPELTVQDLELNKILWLEGWGTWALLPEGTNKTKLIARPGGEFYFDSPLLNFLVNSILFEPIHYMMERKMLIGIKQRAEGHVTPEWADNIQSVLMLLTLAIGVFAGISVLTRKRWWQPYFVALAALFIGSYIGFKQPTILIGIPLVLMLLSSLFWARSFTPEKA